MAVQYLSDDFGVADQVRLELGGDTLLIADTWNIRESILSQPAQWTVSGGHGDVAAEMIKKYPKRTPFKLYIGDVLQFQGRTDGPGASQPAGGAMTVRFRGRDGLAPIHDSYVKAVTGINIATYAQLVWYALGAVGIVAPGSAIDPNVLQTDNAANRQIKAGVPVTQILPHRTVQQILDDAGLVGPNVGVCHTAPQAKLNETWHQFLRRYLDRAGLMLWAVAGGGFMLSAPDADQAPTYQLLRRTGDPTTGGNIVATDYDDDATHRHSEAIIYGRGGGKILGRVKAKGNFQDDEMVAAGYQQPIVFRDAHVSSSAEASYFARRKIAEERRAGWRLEYTVSGHTLPIVGSTTTRAVITPDTVVQVQDDELGDVATGNFYIEGVERMRGPQTTTRIRLMRTTDLVFGGPDDGS